MPTKSESSSEAMPAESSGSAVKCPNCGRDVEAGFKFCDACGTKLEAGPLPTGKTEDGRSARSKPLIERWRDKRRAKRAEPAEPPKTKQDVAPPAAATPPPPVPPSKPPPPPVPMAPARPAPPRITSRPMKAEELRGGATGIAGRLRWQDTKEDEAEKTVERPAIERPPTTWRPAPGTGALPPRSPGATVAVFVLHVLIAFAAGAVLLGLAATVASLTSDGGVAFLEARGLPILIAGSTAIIVFSLLRTGPRARGSRRAIGLSVLIGFVLLVAASALVYQPALMADAQRELDRTLGVFGAEAAASVQRFEADVDQWNTEVNNYRDHLRTIDRARDDETDPERLRSAEERFRIDASGSEESLDGIFERMRSHADAVEHAPLREALEDLAAIFSDELSGVKLITRGFVEDDQALIQSGNTRFTNATDRAVEFFDERVRPLLERGDIDPTALEAAVSELRG